MLDRSGLYSNSGFAGFVEADGYFGIKTSKRKFNLVPTSNFESSKE